MAVGLIDLAVAVEVQTGELPGLRQNLLAVDAIGGDGSELRQGVVGVPVLFTVFLQEVLAAGLGEDVGVQGILPSLVFHVVQGVIKGIDAGAVGVVSQLRLDLAVGLAIYQNIGIGVHGVVGVAQTGALLNHRIGKTGGLIHNGRGGGHQQALGQHSGRDAQRLRKFGLPEVLTQQGHQTRVMGRSHGGTAHDDILVGFRGSAVDGIDIAAGSSNLRLQSQVAGDTPGAEGAHGVDAILREVDANACLVADGHLASVVQRVPIRILPRSAGCPNGIGVGLGDAHAGDVRIALGQIHANGCARYIIINDTGSSASGGVGQLLGEVKLTPGDKDDFAGDIDALVILRVAQLIQEDVLPFRASAVLGGVHGGQRRIII